MTYTTFSDGFAAFIDPAAPNLEYILDTAAGDSSANYDMDADPDDIKDAVLSVDVYDVLARHDISKE